MTHPEPPVTQLESGLAEALDGLYRSESRAVLATLIRLLGDFDLAEEALQEAFTAAAAQWPHEGIPARPLPWLVSTGRFKAIDRMRRRARFSAAMAEIAFRLDDTVPDVATLDQDAIADDRLRLIFTCCHPALPPDAQVAMTLRELCGLTTEEIARAWLTTPPTIAQRIVRAKARIRDERIPYAVPEAAELPGRLDSVLRVVYLLYTEGYEATSGTSLTRVDLTSEAIRLGTLLHDLLPHPEVQGLLALMLLTEARRAGRADERGDLVLLADQDRSRWDQGLIHEGLQLAVRSRATPQVGSYALQAAIAAEHARARTANDTDWARIVAWYDLLRQAEPSPVVDLNRAVALAMRDGPDAGLQLVDALVRRPDVSRHHLAHSARADLLRRLGRHDEAAAAYRRALELVRQEPERRFLERRLGEVTGTVCS